MATTSTIGTASRNYSTITSWLAAFANGGWIGDCYNDTEFTENSGVLFNQATSAANYITLETGAGQSYRDNANVQTNVFAYNQANGVGVSRTANYGYLFQITKDYVTIKNLQLKHTGNEPNSSGIVGIATTSGTNCILDSLIVETGTTFSSVNAFVLYATSGTVRNCLGINRGTAGRGFGGAYNTVGLIANVTLVRTSNRAAAGTCYLVSSGTTKLTNCTSFGYTTVLNNTAYFTGTNYCATDQSSFGVGANNTVSVAYTTATFKVVTDTAHDYKLVSGSALLNVGTADTTDIPAAIDAVGTSRPQGSAWDIGAWELVVAAAASTSGNMAMMGV